MAKQMEGVSERILLCAKAEFLSKGYTDASLRTIAAQAQTTTGSIYTRFGDKAGLFEALVGEQYQHILQRFQSAQDTFAHLPAEEQPERMGKISGDCMMEMLHYCYQHLETFQLILCKSEGTRFAHLVDEMAEIETKATHDYLDVLEQLGRPALTISPALEHIIITGMFNTFFELVIHQMPLQDAEVYLKEMRDFYTAGWAKIMGQ